MTSSPETVLSNPIEPPDESLERLAVLLRLVEGAWALAVFAEPEVRDTMIARLAARLAPIPLLTVPLTLVNADPLAVLNQLPASEQPPVVCFTSVGAAFPDLFGYLDIQRETLALRRERLVFWLRPAELRELATHAPNFYSRISGVWEFDADFLRDAEEPAQHSAAPGALDSTPPAYQRLRPSIAVADETQRAIAIERLRQRIAELRQRRSPDPQQIADAWYDLGGLYYGALPHQYAEAEIAYSQAAEWYERAGMHKARANALFEAGWSASSGYNMPGALKSLGEALELYRLLELSGAQAAVLLRIGGVQLFQADYDAARASLAAALALFRALGERNGEANVLSSLGELQRMQADYDAARASFAAALPLFRALGERNGEANVLSSLGELQRMQADYDAARVSLAAALALFRTLGDRLGEANVLSRLGDLQYRQDDYDAARVSLAAALALFRAIGERNGEANVLAALSRITLGTDDKLAHQLLEEAIDLYNQIDGYFNQTSALRGFGRQLGQLGRRAEAQAYLLRARTLAVEHRYLALIEQIDATSRNLTAQLIQHTSAPATPRIPADVQQKLDRARAETERALEQSPEMRAALARRLRSAARDFAASETRGSPYLALAEQFEALAEQLAPATPARATPAAPHRPSLLRWLFGGRR